MYAGPSPHARIWAPRPRLPWAPCRKPPPNSGPAMRRFPGNGTNPARASGGSSGTSAGAMAFTRADDDLLVAHCPREHAERWWAGAGGERTRSTRLELVNLTDAPAVAKLTLWGQDGPIDTQSSIAVK